ncbi:MAG: hypothetical protein IKW84_09725 [Bacteroidaceae bacterium]|nr:hypothetical protein [Bacteroidaceae bacterium]
MKVYIMPTSNVMTTAYYYSLIQRIFEAAGFDVVMCEGGSLKGYRINKKNDVVVVGNAYPAVKLWLKGYKRICTWYQGVVPEERKMQGCSSLYVYLHSLVERKSLRVTSFFFIISESIKAHFEKKYGTSIETSRSAVIPCFNETDTFDNCFVPGVKKPFSFVYSGGMGVWQCFDKTLDVFKEIKRKIPVATVSIFTFQVDKAKEIVEANGLRGVEVKYVPKEEMNQALSDKMFGFVLREDNTVNRVATPTKFSNYIANGVVPIFSDCVEGFATASRAMKYSIPVSKYDVNGIVDEIIPKAKRIVETYSAVDHKKECDNLFASYYSEGEYIKNVSAKIRTLFNANER